MSVFNRDELDELEALLGIPKTAMSEMASQMIVDYHTPSWTCPDCGTTYFCVGQMRFCPKCRENQAELEKKYWENKSAGMRSVASDIVSKILNGGKTNAGSGMP